MEFGSSIEMENACSIENIGNKEKFQHPQFLIDAPQKMRSAWKRLFHKLQRDSKD